jgi:type IV pilus assembly protein PilC
VEALEITARSMDNVHFKKALSDAREQVTRGVALSRPLKTCGLFPPMVYHMTAIGEETGNIEDMLENIANYYEEDVKATTEQLLALMEPFIIVVMALLVGFMILAMMSPMLTLYSSLG